MKRHIYLVITFLTFISIVYFVNITQAKYKDKKELSLLIVSTPFYLEHTGADITIPYSDNNINMQLAVHNYIDQNYTIENMNYQISIDNSYYSLIVDGNNSINNTIQLEIEGGARNSDLLNLKFNKLNTNQIPSGDEITVTVSSSYPYTYSSSFKVTVIDASIKVTGNPTNWVNTDVTLSVEASNGLNLTEYSFDNGNTWQSSSSKVYTENTSDINVLARDRNIGILGPLKLDITRIDKTPPQIYTDSPIQNLIVTLNESNNLIVSDMHCNDLESGIAQDGIVCYWGENIITNSNTNYFTNVGRWLVSYKVKDEAGNISALTREVLVRWPVGGKYITTRQSVVSSGSGLYADNDSTGYLSSVPYSSKYYYSGKTVNNNMNFSNSGWNIINVAENNTIKLIRSNYLSSGYSWASSGNNWYNSNLINKINNWVSQNHIGDSNEVSIDFSSSSSHVALADFFIGGVTAGDSLQSEVYEERATTTALSSGQSTLWQSKLAIPNVTDFVKASNSTSVVNIETATSGNSYQSTCWMALSSDEWTLNAKLPITRIFLWYYYDAWFLSGGTSIAGGTSGGVTYSHNIRPVIYLKSDTILSGTGTTGDPFVVQENWDWFDSQYTEAI